MKHLFAAMLLPGFAILQGCTTVEPQSVNQSDPAVQRLAIAAESISQHARRQSEVESAHYRQLHGKAASTMDASYVPSLNMVVSLGAPWHGPLDKLIEKLSGVAGWNAPRVLGIKPPGDVMVHVDTDYRSLLDMMADAGTQAGARANVTVKAKERLIEIEYLKPAAY